MQKQAEVPNNRMSEFLGTVNYCNLLKKHDFVSYRKTDYTRFDLFIMMQIAVHFYSNPIFLPFNFDFFEVRLKWFENDSSDSLEKRYFIADFRGNAAFARSVYVRALFSRQRGADYSLKGISKPLESLNGANEEFFEDPDNWIIWNE